MVPGRDSQAYTWKKNSISIAHWYGTSTHIEFFEVLAVLGVDAVAASVASLIIVPAFRFLGVTCTESDMLPTEIEFYSISNLSTGVTDGCLREGGGRTSRE